jgi:hypothetical protein
VFGISRVAMVEVGIVRIPAGVGTEMELRALTVAGRNGALQVRSPEGNRLLADVALAPEGCGGDFIARHRLVITETAPIVLPLDARRGGMRRSFSNVADLMTDLNADRPR